MTQKFQHLYQSCRRDINHFTLPQNATLGVLNFMQPALSAQSRASHPCSFRRLPRDANAIQDLGMAGRRLNKVGKRLESCGMLQDPFRCCLISITVSPRDQGTLFLTQLNSSTSITTDHCVLFVFVLRKSPLTRLGLDFHLSQPENKSRSGAHY